ncbi:MAG: hypothetical protein BRD55_11305 [Bacteroidetes bacterium SW_9_63_38]|nr:MAG: hypothetical protein BRD55_11305 [Bacteroidetes bacterium SW_9_63_38]
MGLLSPVLVSDTAAQDPSTRTRSLHRSRISIWGAHSVSGGSILGKIPDIRLRMLGLRYHYLLIPANRAALDSHDAPTLTYTADFLPAVGLHIPRDAALGAVFPNGPQSRTALTTSGVGLYPMGLRVHFSTTARVHPFVDGHTGFLYFFDPVPDARGRAFNFAAALGGGVSVTLSGRWYLALGYRYHHLSNGFRGSINPGLDANLLYLGLGAGL